MKAILCPVAKITDGLLHLDLYEDFQVLKVEEVLDAQDKRALKFTVMANLDGHITRSWFRAYSTLQPIDYHSPDDYLGSCGDLHVFGPRFGGAYRFNFKVNT